MSKLMTFVCVGGNTSKNVTACTLETAYTLSCIHVCTHVCTRIHTYLYTCTHLSVYTYTLIYKHVYTHICIHVHTYLYTRIHTYANPLVYCSQNTQTFTCTHTHTHTNTHTQAYLILGHVGGGPCRKGDKNGQPFFLRETAGQVPASMCGICVGLSRTVYSHRI